MITHARTLLVAAVAAAITGGCESLPTGVAGEPAAPAFALGDGPGRGERSVSEALYDMTDVHFVFGCDDRGEALESGEGELVRMEGSIYERITLLRDAAGGYHLVEHTMPVGLRGVGLTSGEEFRVAEREHRTAGQGMRGYTGVYRQELKLVGVDTRRTFWVVWSGHYTITADDQIIVQRDRERVQCKL